MIAVYENNQLKTISDKHLSYGEGQTKPALPIGAIFPACTTLDYSDVLLLDGSTFDETEYPALYQLLGTNVLPDFREVVPVGAGQRDDTVYGNHDVFTVGETKSDTYKSHATSSYTNKYLSSSTTSQNYKANQSGNASILSNRGFSRRSVSAASYSGGSTTHGKQIGVNYYIIAR